MTVEQIYSRQETLPLQAIAVEQIGDNIGGGHQGNTALEQSLQQQRQDHGIGNIADKELIEADHPRFTGYGLGNGIQGISLSPVVVEILVNPPHKAVEMDAHLFFKGQALVETVHQESLPPANTAPEIEPSLRCLGRFQQFGQQTALFTVVARHQTVKKILQLINRKGLVSICDKALSGEIILVALFRG